MKAKDNSLASIFHDLKLEIENAEFSKRFAEQELEAMYAIAFHSLQQNQLEKAGPIFTLLCTYRPTIKKYLMGLGICCQMAKMYDEAIDTFSLVGAWHRDSPEATLRVAQCYIETGEPEKAVEALRLVVNYCNENKGFDAVGERATGLLDILNNSANRH